MKQCVGKRHVGLLVKFLNNAISKEVNSKLTKFNLTGAQHEVLVYILKNEKKRDVFQKDIEQHLKLKNPTVTGIIKRLEEKKMIVRCASHEDARYKKLNLTEEGHEVLHKCFHEGIMSVETKLIQGMTNEEVRQFKDYLNIALKNLED